MLNFTTQADTKYKWVSTLIGKAWIKDISKGFTVAPLTTPVEGKKDEYELAPVFPLILNEYARTTFGPNKKHDASKNNNTHWQFLEVREDKLEEYKAEMAKIGQTIELGDSK